MKKTSELIWEFSVALIAFAGAFTLLSSFFPSIPSFIFGGLFLVAFLFMLVSFAWRFYEYQHPVEITVADILVDTCFEDAPKLEIAVGFSARDKVNIMNIVHVRFDESLDRNLRAIATFHPLCVLDETVKAISIEGGGYV